MTSRAVLFSLIAPLSLCACFPKQSIGEELNEDGTSTSDGTGHGDGGGSGCPTDDAYPNCLDDEGCPGDSWGLADSCGDTCMCSIWCDSDTDCPRPSTGSADPVCDVKCKLMCASQTDCPNGMHCYPSGECMWGTYDPEECDPGGGDGGVGDYDAVDILFVIDNSGSMGEEQRKLAASFSSFVSVLEADGAQADYRIGITTTDNGNPWCSGTTPEGGTLRLLSCLSRLDEFTFTGTDPPTDMESACTATCTHETIDILPTTTDEDDVPKPRPWLESVDGTTNLPDGVSMVEAFQCFAPQGINGCGFESQLESMYKAIARTADPGEASHGFIREEALLAVIFVSDEVDCSYDPAAEEIFLPESDRVFWSDPHADYPTSALCWNAGVACTDGPGTYDECHAENKDLEGNPTGDADAVLQPLSRYVGQLSDHPTIVFGITGVPAGYVEGQDIVYQDTMDEGFQHDFGIGPGCESATGLAVPPVRVREVAAAFADGSSRPLLHSICADSYASALQAIAARLE